MRRLTSVRSCSTSCRAGAEMPAIEGGAASMMRSANRANSSSGVESGEEASTARTFAGRRWRNSSRTSASSVSVVLLPSSCCIFRNSCEGFLSPSSSEVSSCCSRRLEEVPVRWTSISRRRSYGRDSGGCKIISRTSKAYSGASEATMWSNFVFCAVIPRVPNCASTWANQTSGSEGQNGGSFRVPKLVVRQVPQTSSHVVVTNCWHARVCQTELYDLHIHIIIISTYYVRWNVLDLYRSCL